MIENKHLPKENPAVQQNPTVETPPSPAETAVLYKPTISFRICVFLCRFKLIWALLIIVPAILTTIILLLVFASEITQHSFLYSLGPVSPVLILLSTCLSLIFLGAGLLSVATVFEHEPNNAWIFWPTLFPIVVSVGILSLFIIGFLLSVVF